jgi:hypothetical protein
MCKHLSVTAKQVLICIFKFVGSPYLALRWRCVCTFSPYCEYVSGNNKEYYIGFEDITAVVMKSSIIRDVTPCIPLTFNGLYSIIFQKMERFKKEHLGGGILSGILRYPFPDEANVTEIASNSWPLFMQFVMKDIQVQTMALAVSELGSTHPSLLSEFLVLNDNLSLRTHPSHEESRSVAINVLVHMM